MDYTLLPREKLVLELIVKHSIKPHTNPDELYRIIHKEFPHDSEHEKEYLVVACITWATAAAIGGQTIEGVTFH